MYHYKTVINLLCYTILIPLVSSPVLWLKHIQDITFLYSSRYLYIMKKIYEIINFFCLVGYRCVYNNVTHSSASLAGYLLVGLTFTMLTLTIFYDIPQLNFGVLFLRRSDEATTDPEKVRLQAPGSLGPKYTPDQHLPIKLDTPSPEDTTPVHARP